MRWLLIALSALWVGAGTQAATIQITTTLDPTTFEHHFTPPSNEELQVAASIPSTLVSPGDTVRVTVNFPAGQSLPLLLDPDSIAIGTQAWLETNSGITAEFGFTFTFLNGNGLPSLSETAARTIRQGGGLHGDVTVLQQIDLSIGGLQFEFTEIANAGSGGLPTSFNAVRILVHNADFGNFYDEVAPIAAPEPQTLALLSVAGLLSFGLRRRVYG